MADVFLQVLQRRDERAGPCIAPPQQAAHDGAPRVARGSGHARCHPSAHLMTGQEANAKHRFTETYGLMDFLRTTPSGTLDMFELRSGVNATVWTKSLVHALDKLGVPHHEGWLDDTWRHLRSLRWDTLLPVVLHVDEEVRGVMLRHAPVSFYVDDFVERLHSATAVLTPDVVTKASGCNSFWAALGRGNLVAEVDAATALLPADVVTKSSRCHTTRCGHSRPRTRDVNATREVPSTFARAFGLSYQG